MPWIALLERAMEPIFSTDAAITAICKKRTELKDLRKIKRETRIGFRLQVTR